MRIKKLEENYTNFVQVDDKLVINGVDSDFDQFEEDYFEVKSILLGVLEQRKVNVPIPDKESDKNANQNLSLEQLNSTISDLIAKQNDILLETVSYKIGREDSDVKLPKITLPSFGGDYKD